jgi:hypothetical protein
VAGEHKLGGEKPWIVFRFAYLAGLGVRVSLILVPARFCEDLDDEGNWKDI